MRRRSSACGRLLAAVCAVVLVIALVLGVRAIFFRPLARFTSVGTNPTDQAWLGFGINEYPQDRNRSGAAIPWTNSAWALTTQRLAFLRPGLTRINVYLGWFNPSGNLTSFDWNTWQMRNLDQVLSWYRASGLRVQIGMWHDVVDGPPDNPDVYTSKAWADVQAALLYRLVKVDGYGNIYGYAGLNEWDCQYMHPPAGFTWSQWQTATSNLRSAFTAAGLHTALIGPDTGCSGPSAPLRAAEDEPGALAAYEDHDYPTERQIISGEVESQYAPVVSRVDRADARRKPLYVAEMGVSDPDYTPDPPIGSYAYGLDMFDYAVQALRSGAAGALAWCLDGFDDNKNCGMWNISGNDGGTALRPWFYAWSLLCRFFPPGATIYAMREPAQVRIAAARIPIGNGSSSWTFALVNRLSTPQVVTLAMPGWRGGTFDEFVYSSSNRTVNASGFPVPRQQIVATHGKPLTGLTVTVSPNSAVLLTTASALPAA